jgi:hypothetical protein
LNRKSHAFRELYTLLLVPALLIVVLVCSGICSGSSSGFLRRLLLLLLVLRLGRRLPNGLLKYLQDFLVLNFLVGLVLVEIRGRRGR